MDDANLFFEQTLNKILSELDDIYFDAWQELAEEIDPLIYEVVTDDESLSLKQKMDHANKNKSLESLTSVFTLFAIGCNLDAISIINGSLNLVYKVGYNTAAKNLQIPLLKEDINSDDILSKYTKRAYQSSVQKNYISAEIMDIIKKGFRDGKGTKYISKKIEMAFKKSKSSAMRIARTEINRIRNASTYDAMKQAERAGVNFKKIWRHSIVPKRPRDWHMDMDGESKEVDELFSNGLLFPNDPDGSAKEVINCMCYMQTELI